MSSFANTANSRRDIVEMIECESCIGSGKIREEGDTPAQDTWRRCMDCTGTGQLPAKPSNLQIRLNVAQALSDRARYGGNADHADFKNLLYKAAELLRRE